MPKPLGAKSRSLDIWNPILEKCERKLTRWRSQYLSLGIRLTLINSVLDVLPIYTYICVSVIYLPYFPVSSSEAGQNQKKFLVAKY